MSERLYLLSGPPLAPFILPSVPEALQKGVSKYVHNEIVQAISTVVIITIIVANVLYKQKSL